MCEYSARYTKIRPAKTGDKLISAHLGFVAYEDRETAICLRPGTELAFDKPLEVAHILGRWFSRWINKNSPRTLALFRQQARYGRQQDLLEFPDGRLDYLIGVYPGQVATVLQVPAPLTLMNRTRKNRRRHGADIAGFDPVRGPSCISHIASGHITTGQT